MTMTPLRLQEDIDGPHEPSKLPNPFTAVKVLAGHSDITRRLVKLDESRFASYGDDGKIIIWDVESGRCLHTLETHSLRVTCCLLLEDNLLLTGSSDRKIREWNTDSGVLTKELYSHKSTVKCLILVHYKGVEYFCSGGDDLCLWNKKGELLQKLHPINDESDIHTLVAVKNDRIIAATANSTSLDIYQLGMKAQSPILEPYSKIPPGHREAIRCLIPISEAMFASGSLDGVIYFWSSHTFTVTRQFNCHEKYQDQYTKAYQYAVNQLVTCGNHVLAAIGNGFQVYNSNEPESTACIADLPQAHSAPVNSIVYNYYRSIVITCSHDASIRLWELDILNASKLSPRKIFMSQKIKRPPLIGELKGHDGAVMYALDFGIDGFASCGSDNVILLWKDGTREASKQIGIVRNRKQRDCEALTASLMKNLCSTNTK